MDKYFGDVMQAYQAGAQMDLRVRYALELLKEQGEPMFKYAAGIVSDNDIGEKVETREQAAIEIGTIAGLMAQAAADRIFNSAAELGLIKGMPDSPELSAHEKHHIGRQVRQQVFAQAESKRAVDRDPKLQVVQSMGPAA